MRLSLRKPKEDTWEISRKQYVLLENIGDKNLMLNLASGKFRFDKGRQFRFRRDILDDEAVQAYLDARQLAIVDE